MKNLEEEIVGPLSREVSGTLESSHNRMISAAQQSMPATIEAIKKAIKDYMSLRTNYQGEFSRLKRRLITFPMPNVLAITKSG